MKASLSMAAVLFAASIPAAHAQTELAIANHTGSNPNLAIKDQEIQKLKAEVAALKAEIAVLKGETPRHSELQAEAVPIIPDATPAPAAPQSSGKTYTVVAGDGLMKIARKTNCKAADIAAVNGMTMNDIIRPGQVLKLPTTATVAATPASEAPVPPKANIVEETTKPKTYKIKDGETYYSISRRLKIPLDELMAANPKAPANRLYTGRVINLPMKGAVPAPAPTPAVAETTPDPTPAVEAPPATDVAETPAADTPPAPAPQKKIIAVSVNEEISYGDFAAKHGTDTERLNSLNDLSLTSATILAKGSELYVPSQP